MITNLLRRAIVAEKGLTYSQGASTEEAREETTYENGLQVFPCRDGKIEDGETKRSNDQRKSPALQFGERRPENRTRCKTQDVERRAQDAHRGTDVELVCDDPGCCAEDGTAECCREGCEAQHGAGEELLPNWPVLRVQWVVWPFEFHDVLFSFWQRRGVWLSGAEARERFPRLPTLDTRSYCCTMLATLCLDSAQSGGVALEVDVLALGGRSRYANLTFFPRGFGRRGGRRRGSVGAGDWLVLFMLLLLGILSLRKALRAGVPLGPCDELVGGVHYGGYVAG